MHSQISNIIHAFSENVQESLFFIVFHHFQCPFLLRNSFISYILGVYSAAGDFLGQEGMGVSFSKGKTKQQDSIFEKSTFTRATIARKEDLQYTYNTQVLLFLT